MNVDEREIAKFSALAARWWDLEGEFKPLHQINPLRLQFIQQQCDGLFGLKVADVGCGGGILSESMARAGAHVTAIDLAEESLKVARLHALESGQSVDYQYKSAEQLAEECPAQFDVVTCLEMLEHVPDPAAVVQACASLVKPGGKVFFSTLNRNLKSYLFAILGAERLFKLVPMGTHDYAKFITPAELLGWVDNTQLKARSMTGLHFDPINQSYYLSDKNVDVNYIVACERLA